MEYSISFSRDERSSIEKYANLYGISASEYIRRATLEMIENDADARAFDRSKKIFSANPVTYSHEEIGSELRKSAD